MGKIGNSFSSIKTLSPSSKEKKSQKSEKKRFVEEHPSVPNTSIVENAGGSSYSHPFPPPEEVKLLEVEAEPPQAASGAAASTATMTRLSGISREEVAAIRIQTTFRGYLARRALWGLRGLVRLKTVVEGPSVKRQTVNTLKYTQSLSNLQYQINSRRIQMLEENQAHQKQLQRAKEMANMQVQDQSQSSFEVTDDLILQSIYESVSDAIATPTPSSTAPRIPRVPGTMREKHDYQKYYVPMVVSIGPYHFGNPKLQLVEKRKPVIAMKLFSNNKDALRSLFQKLGEPEIVKDLRSFYEENSTNKYCDKLFTKMMLLDGCFILYFIDFLYSGRGEDYSEFKSNELFYIRRDLYLLENQIPFKVLKEVMSLLEVDLLEYIEPFIAFSSFVIGSNKESGDEDDEEPNHLLGSLHCEHSRIIKSPTRAFNRIEFDHCNFRSVSELTDVGIYFKPMKDTLSMTHIEFAKGWWCFSANVKLPSIAVSEYTRPMLLNMIAYEMCLRSTNDSWVTAYVCLLDSLIDHAEDVKLLRKAWVLYNYLASDKEVVELFDQISIDLVPSSFAYLEAKYKMQRHYDSRRNTLFSQLKNEYFKSPWAFFALLGALIALFLTGVQTYYTIWSPKSTCDDLCMFLKINHHL